MFTFLTSLFDLLSGSAFESLFDVMFLDQIRTCVSDWLTAIFGM